MSHELLRFISIHRWLVLCLDYQNFIKFANNCNFVIFYVFSTGQVIMSSASRDFYLRYYVGHKGKFGHEFLEFEFRPDGKLRYANNSNYKNDTMIRKEVYVSQAVINELRRIVEDSEIMKVIEHIFFMCIYKLSKN